MKKISLIAFLFLYITVTQASDLLELRAGLGFNTSKLSPNPNGFTSNYAGGFLLGGDIMFGKRLYLNSGVYYFGMSSKLSDNQNTSELQFSKIKVPLLIGYKLIPLESLINVRVFAGPSLSYVTNIKSDDIKDIDKNDFNRGLFSANVGLGFDFLFMFADAGYEIGMSNVFKNTDLYGNSKNGAFYAMAGVRLKL